LWDAIGSEFGGRHELYERNYAGNHEEVRLQSLVSAQRSGQMQKMQDLVDQCMGDYDEQGWTTDDWVGPSSNSNRAAE
jgi:4-hydroxyphenylacetate 3-monooxygenase